MKHILLSLLMLLLLLPAFSLADGLDEQALALLDAAACAAAEESGEVIVFDADDTVPEAFALRLLHQLGQDASADLLKTVVSAPLPDLSKAVPDRPSVQAGLELLTFEFSDDGSVMTVSGQIYIVDEKGYVLFLDPPIAAEIRKNASSPFGWALYRFVQAEAISPAAVAYHARIMAEYVNAEEGFAILYPDIFPEDSFVDEPSGVSAALPGGEVSFYVHREPNEKNWTLEALLAEQKKENPSLETNMDELTGCARTRCLTDEGLLEINFYLLSEASVYHAQFVCPQEKEKDYALYLMYMMNSFTADELGLG